MNSSKKAVIATLMLLPPLVFLLGSLFGYIVDTGVIVRNSSLLRTQELFVGTLFCGLTTFIFTSLLGTILYQSENRIIILLGKGLYGVSFVLAFMMVLNHHAFSETLIKEDQHVRLAFGAYLMYIGIALGFLTILSILLIDLIAEVFEKRYQESRESPKKRTNVIKELRAWKELQDKDQITQQEYDEIKNKRLTEISLDENEPLVMLEKLRAAQEDEIIDKEDFNRLKAKLLDKSTE